MGLPRSIDAPVATADEAEIVARIEAICEEFEAYGSPCRCRAAPPRHHRQQQETVRPDARTRPAAQAPQRFVATTDSDHDGPTLPRTSRLTGRTSSGSPTSSVVMSRAMPGRASSADRSMRVSPGGAQSGHSIAAAPGGLHPPFGSRLAVRRDGLSQAARSNFFAATRDTRQSGERHAVEA